jgi:hypothetical protein
MQSKANGKQTLWVLAIALVLIALCLGGLWTYIQSADAETGMQETALAQIPESSIIAYTPEKYDNFPSGDPEFEKDFGRVQGCGLNRKELQRLPKLLEAYAAGERPKSKAPSLPGEDGFAIIPLDPKAFGGMAEYYILPQAELSDEQILMLIDYSALKNETFGIDTTDWKNCMREGYPESNRYLSAGESNRRDILLQRLKAEGIRPESSEITLDKLPLSGVGSIRLNKMLNRNNGTFHLYPVRELTDEELMQSLYLDYLDGYSYLIPETDASINPAADEKKMRAFFEDIMGMPLSSENTELIYRRKDDTGEIHLHARFTSALINGVETSYIAIMRMDTGEILYTSRMPDDKTKPDQAYYLDQPNTDINMLDPRWIEIAKTAVSKLTHMKITKAYATDVSGTADNTHITVGVDVSLEDGSSYMVAVKVSDKMIASAQFLYYDFNVVNDYIW